MVLSIRLHDPNLALRNMFFLNLQMMFFLISRLIAFKVCHFIANSDETEM